MADGVARARSAAGLLAIVALVWAGAEFRTVRQAGLDLCTPSAPHGVVSWELAWSPDHARAILEEWRDTPASGAAPATRLSAARASLEADRWFIGAYTLAIFLTALWGVWAAGASRTVGAALLTLPLLVALADLGENRWLTAQLDFVAPAGDAGGASATARNAPSDVTTRTEEFARAVTGARVAAKAKFVILLLAVFGALTAAGGALRAGRKPPPRGAEVAAAERRFPGKGSFDDLVEFENHGIFAACELRTADAPKVRVNVAAGEPWVQFRAADVIGLALSGGGIRSATFNLGWLQGLHRLNLLRLIDYVSTVSGGGYVGSFWSEWLARKSVPVDDAAGAAGAARAPTPTKVAPDVMFPTRRDCGPGPQDRTDSHQERHLREFSGFLAPRVGVFEVETWTAVVAVVTGLLPALAIALSVVGLSLISWLLAAAPVAATSWVASLLMLWSLTLATLFGFEQIWRSVKSESAGVAPGVADHTGRWGNWGPTIVFALGALALVAAAHYVVVSRQGSQPYRVWLAVPVAATGAADGEDASETAFVSGWCDVSTGEGTPGCGRAESGTWWGLIGASAPTEAWVVSPRLFDYSVAWLAASLVLVFGRLSYAISPKRASFGRSWRRRWLSAYDRVLMRLLGLAVLWAAVGALWHLAMNLASLWTAVMTAVLSAGVFAALRNWIGHAFRRPEKAGLLGRLKPYVPQVLAYLTLVLATAAMGRVLLAWGGSDWYRWWTGASAMSALLLIGLFIDPHRFGLHAFYRDRISRAYAGACNLAGDQHAGHNRGTEPRAGDDRPVVELASRPLHLVCCAANDLSGDSLETLARGARSAVVSRYGLSIGPFWSAPEEGLTLGSVVTASAAAFNSAMGQVSMRIGPVVSFLMTALNLRLGLWLRHPLAAEPGARRWPGLLLYRELFGWTSASGTPRSDGSLPRLLRDLHLSDGAHFENLALYELVRRHCRYVIVSDCTADPEVAFDDLGNAIRRIREDFGVDVSIDVSPLRPGPDGRSAQHVAVGTIDYSPTDRGILLYVKPSITGDEPPDVLQYRTRNPTFPHEGTSDQFYDEAQWESYRRLGLHAAQSVFAFLPAPVFPGAATAATATAAPECHDVTADWVFAEAAACWGTTPPWLEAQVLEMTRRFADLEKELERRPRRGLQGEVFPEVGWVGGLLHADADHLADLSVLLRVTQLMEDAWLACGLDTWWSHPLNLGWINLFGRWATAPTFRMWWPLLKPMYNPQFGRFIEQRFPVPAAEPPDLDGPSARHARSSRLLPIVADETPGLAQQWWTQRSTQPRHWEGRAVIQHLLSLRRPDGSVVEVQVGILAALVGTHCVAWTSDDFFVPPSLWGAGLGGTFLELLLDEFCVAFDKCSVVVKAPPEGERHHVALDDRRRFIEQYRKAGFRQQLKADPQCGELDGRTLGNRPLFDPAVDTLLVLDLAQWRARRGLGTA